MPELPEVETLRRYLETTSLHLPVTRVEVRDKKVVQTSEDELNTALRHRSFTATARVGKHLLVLTDGGPVLVLHFGMTGSLGWYRYEEDTPRFARVIFHLHDGSRLAFIDPRKFGRIRLATSVESYCREKKLGPDALAMELPELLRQLKRRQAPIKPVLLDQKVLAGIGNWIADEVLFGAGIHPEARAASLSEGDVARLHEVIGRVLQTAIQHEAEYRFFPPSYLIHARGWDDSPHPEADGHKKCPVCGHQIEKTVVGGRATYLCPSCQPERKQK